MQEEWNKLHGYVPSKKSEKTVDEQEEKAKGTSNPFASFNLTTGVDEEGAPAPLPSECRNQVWYLILELLVPHPRQTVEVPAASLISAILVQLR
jgi:hypothetical protein